MTGSKLHFTFFRKDILFPLMALVVAIFLIEVFSIILVYFRFRDQNSALVGYSNSATIMIIEMAYDKYKRAGEPKTKILDRLVSDPSPFFVANERQGYGTKPGTYAFKSITENGTKTFKLKVTINEKGQRFVGNPSSSIKKKIHVFGDSWVFGWGVNDEHTFSYLLQSAFPTYKFSLYAAAGYSLSNAYIDFLQIKDQLNSNDLIILGYASYFKVRQVAAPSRLREYGEPSEFLQNPKVTHLRAGLDSSKNLVFEYVPLFCKFSGEYCNKSDPSQAYMDEVTAKLINSISQQTSAKVVLFYFYGPKEDPVFRMLNENIIVIPATKNDFDYETWDAVNGFGGHPGSVWHHAMFQKLSEYLGSRVQ